MGDGNARGLSGTLLARRPEAQYYLASARPLGGPPSSRPSPKSAARIGGGGLKKEGDDPLCRGSAGRL
jgi:hypothetical protein